VRRVTSAFVGTRSVPLWADQDILTVMRSYSEAI
jgi:hypothetical protein